jgi:hypothetical protein
MFEQAVSLAAIEAAVRHAAECAAAGESRKKLPSINAR